MKSSILISRSSRSEVRRLREQHSRRREPRDVANPSHGFAGIFSRQNFPSMSNQLSEANSPIALTEHAFPTKQHCHAKVDSSGAKVRFIPSPEFLSEFVRWRQSRMEILSPKCTFDRWYEALLKEQIWHQWVSNGLVKSMDIPSRNTLAHLYVNAKTPSTEKRIRSATKGLLALQRAHCAALAFTTNIIFL